MSIKENALPVSECQANDWCHLDLAKRMRLVPKVSGCFFLIQAYILKNDLMSEYDDGLHIPDGLLHESEIDSFNKNSEGKVGTMGKSQSEQVSTYHKSFKKKNEALSRKMNSSDLTSERRLEI